MGGTMPLTLRRAALAALLVLARAHAVSAEPTPSEKETARSLMDEGRELRDKNDLQSALKRFQSADLIMHVPTTSLEVARTQVALGLLVEARETLHGIGLMPASPSDPRPFQVAREQASKLDDELRDRIGAFRFELHGLTTGVTATVSIDGQPIPSVALELPFRVDPGRHMINARAGAMEITREVESRERETVTVALGFENTIAPPASQQEPEKQEPRGWPALAYVGFGVGAAGVAVGSIAGILAISSKHATESKCTNDLCPPSAWDDVDRTRTYMTVSTVGFTAGLLGAGLGVGSLIWQTPSAGEVRPPTRPSVRVTVHPVAGGVYVVGQY
jgi:hypothetical protein